VLALVGWNRALASQEASPPARARMMGASPTPACDPPAWRIVSSPGTASLSDVAAIAPDDVWAVGQGLSMHWDGTAWSLVPIPAVGYAIFLDGVAALGPDDVWAAGDYLTPPLYRTYIIHWHAGHWTLVDSPNPGDYNFLRAVSAISPNDVWAAGDYSAGSGYRTLTMHWNGIAWSVVPSPSPDASDNRLYDIAAISSNDVWAVGSYRGDVFGLSMHWDGSAWQVVPTFPLNPVGGAGVDGVAANDVWAVGGRSIVRWDGSQWNLVSSPAPPNSYLVKVKVLAADDAWAVGYYRDTGSGVNQTLTLHWNGVAWSLVPSPNTGSENNVLNGVSAVASNDVWTVGRYGSSAFHSLTERYNSDRPCSTPTPTLTTIATSTSTTTPTDAITPTPIPTQCVGNYIYNVSAGTIISGTSLVPGSQCRACAVNLNLPFPFTFYGQAYSRANVSSEGNLQFLTTYVCAITTCPLPEPHLGPAILPNWDSYMDTAPFAACEQYAGGPCGIYTSLSGSAPDRILNIQWRTHFWATSQHTANFEMRLYEGTGRIDFVYGQVDYSGGRATIGVQDGAGLLTQYACNTEVIIRGLLISWSPPPCEPAFTLTPTRTRLATPPPTDTSTPTVTPARTGTPLPAITSIPTATACSAILSDVSPSDYFYQPVSYLYCHGVISGYADGTFRPYNLTTRGQLAKIVVLTEDWPLHTPTTPTFRDVLADNPFYLPIETAYNRQVISGYSCGAGCLEYRPGNNVTRGQLTKIIVLAQGWAITPPGTPTFRDVGQSDPFYGFVETAYAHNVISGYACGAGCLEFRPGNNATRGQISKIVFIAITGP
jgi:hypothetical protein